MKNLFYFILILTLSSCGYYSDKQLQVINNSSQNIWYQILIKYKNNETYLHIGIGRKLNAHEQDIPIVKRNIKDEIDDFSHNKILYIIYYNDKEMEYVHQNLELLIDSKKFKVDKYTLKELDSMNWVVKYPRNNKD